MLALRGHPALQVLLAKYCTKSLPWRTIGIADAVKVRHGLPVLAGDLHLLVHGNEASPVRLRTHCCQVEALHAAPVVSTMA